eukprot:INCI5890.3.p2 GENE.INCI5890.3~~INCI5890.3.p2  ORF type:complete len:210 (-),score=41.78 INCI5890.3:252-881(-)
MGLNLLNAYILGQVQLNTVLGRQALIHSPYQFKDRRAGALSVSALRQAAVKLREKTKQRLRAAAARASNGNDDTRRRQLYKLEDEDDYDNDDEALTTAAKRSVGDFYFVGITEEMDASMCLLGVRLGRHLHHRRYLIRGPIEKVNPTFEITNRSKELLTVALGPELHMYEFALKRLHTAIASVRHYAQRDKDLEAFLKNDRWCRDAHIP